MHPAIQIREDQRRGCGWRKAGGMYLVSGGRALPCGKLPVPLSILNTCPHCGVELPTGYGVRVSRAPRMLYEPENLWKDLSCRKSLLDLGSFMSFELKLLCGLCPLRDGNKIGPALLVWVGEKFYPEPVDFVRESQKMGISRRITSVPKDFVAGKTFVLLAHVKACHVYEKVSDVLPDPFVVVDTEPKFEPGIFSIFKPEAIEVVVTGDEPDDVIDDYVKRGLQPVRVRKIATPNILDLGPEDFDE